MLLLIKFMLSNNSSLNCISEEKGINQKLHTCMCIRML